MRKQKQYALSKMGTTRKMLFTEFMQIFDGPVAIAHDNSKPMLFPTAEKARIFAHSQGLKGYEPVKYVK